MKFNLRIPVVIVSILYPFFVFAGMVYFKMSPRVFVAALACLLLLNIVGDWSSFKKGKPKKMLVLRLVGMTVAIGVISALVIITDDAGYSKLYPVIMNILFLGVFGSSLIKSPTIIWKIASMQDKTLEDSPHREKVVSYCRKVTKIWCVFFIFNIGMATFTTFFASDLVWSAYNGLISYILMGLLFAIELFVRKRVQRSYEITES